MSRVNSWDVTATVLTRANLLTKLRCVRKTPSWIRALLLLSSLTLKAYLCTVLTENPARRATSLYDCPLRRRARILQICSLMRGFRTRTSRKLSYLTECGPKIVGSNPTGLATHPFMRSGLNSLSVSRIELISSRLRRDYATGTSLHGPILLSRRMAG